MKNLNKKLYSVIIVCLLMFCFTIVGMATDIIVSSDVSQSSKEEAPSSNLDETISSKVSSNLSSEVTTSDGSEVTSVDNSSVNSTENVLNGSSDAEDSGDSKEESSSVSKTTSSSITNSNTTTSVESKNENSVSVNTSSKKSNYSNVGGVVNDEPDTSGWGDSQESSEEISSAEDDTNKRKNKNITDYSGLLWILIWIPILLILASVGALVYVNRKAFLEEDTLNFDDADEPDSTKKKHSAAEKAKRKNNHKNRTNVYRPRD